MHRGRPRSHTGRWRAPLAACALITKSITLSADEDVATVVAEGGR